MDYQRAYVKRRRDIETNGLEDFYALRKRWSRFVGICIGALILSQIVIVILIGSNVLKYDSTVVISIFFSETIVQIIGLAILMVKFLFADKSMVQKFEEDASGE